MRTTALRPSATARPYGHVAHAASIKSSRRLAKLRATGSDGGDPEPNPLLESFKKYKKEQEEQESSTASVATADPKAKEERKGFPIPKFEYKSKTSKETSSVQNDTLFGSLAPGALKNSVTESDWQVACKNLTDFGLKSVSAAEAADLAKSGKAVIVDCRTPYFFQREHAEGAVSVPLNIKLKGSGSLKKRVFLGSRATEKNPNFEADAKAALVGNETRTIIVTCATGGTIEREVERTSKSERDAYVDSQRAFGRDSLSLRACSALVDAGITNIVHMDGGMAAWKAAGLAVQGSAIKENAIEGLPWLGTGLEIYGTDENEEVLEKKPSIFGITYQSKAISAWPVVYSFLVDMKLKTLNADQAERQQRQKATVLDVSTAAAFVEEHIEGAVSVPLNREIEEKGKKRNLGLVRNFFSGTVGAPIERNLDFIKDVESVLGAAGKQPVVVTCDFGGTLDRGLVTKYGREYQDPDKRFGRESSSLRACYELIQAGYTNVMHLDGGNQAWKEAKLPMKEQFTQQIFWENKGAIVLVLLSLRYFFYLLEN